MRIARALVLSVAGMAAATGLLAADGVALAAQPAVPDATTVDTAVDASGRSIDVSALAQRLRSARHVLLGELHDDAAQHRLRAAVLKALLADGRPSWVVFEQIDREHNAALAGALRDTEAVVTAGQLDRKAWAWPLHRPLFDAALAAGATVVGGNLSRAEAGRVVTGGAARAPLALQRWLAAPGATSVESPPGWTLEQDAELRRQVDEGHCGALPAAMTGPMALAQRARDAALAAAMMAAPPGARVVLIAGNGHVRRDIGVPHYLAAAQAGDIVSVGFLERGPDGATRADGPYDEAWFTAPVDRPDPCASFRPPGAAQQAAAQCTPSSPRPAGDPPMPKPCAPLMKQRDALGR
ncbi:MAG: ChaN family lipoprotein [Burkholderiaceae bacterium]|nr:ChaN family lipoprotein [Burkholderiaceae bacterium]